MPVFTDAIAAAAPSGYYITSADLVAYYGEQNIITWSNQDGSSATAINTERVNQAIAWAEEEIHNAFRGRRYQLPFTATNVTVVSWALHLAGWDLATWRGTRDEDALTDKMDSLRVNASREMLMVISGARSINSPKVTTEPSAPWGE